MNHLVVQEGPGNNISGFRTAATSDMEEKRKRFQLGWMDAKEGNRFFLIARTEEPACSAVTASGGTAAVPDESGVRTGGAADAAMAASSGGVAAVPDESGPRTEGAADRAVTASSGGTTVVLNESGARTEEGAATVAAASNGGTEAVPAGENGPRTEGAVGTVVAASVWETGAVMSECGARPEAEAEAETPVEKPV